MSKKLLSLLLILLSILSCVDNKNIFTRQDNRNEIDSLLDLAFEKRFSNIDSMYILVTKALSDSNISSAQITRVENALGYVAFMDMDYEKSIEYYEKVLNTTNNQLELLIANIGLMRTSQRTSANREFYDYLTNASKYIKNLHKESEFLSADEYLLLINTQAEFEIISLIYFANLGIEVEQIKALSVFDEISPLVLDSSLILYKELIECSGITNAKPSMQQLSRLVVALEMCEKEGYVWLAAGYKLMLSIFLREDVLLNTLNMELPRLMSKINSKNIPIDNLPQSLAIEAVDYYNLFGDKYKEIESLIILASIYVQKGDYAMALDVSQDALNDINDYNNTHFGALDSLPMLMLCQNDEFLERNIIEKTGRYGIPELILTIRQQISCAYAGLGDKVASDLNRNSYLDLLRLTRQNREVESRMQQTLKNFDSMEKWAFIVFISILVVSILLFMLNRRWRVYNRKYTSQLSLVLCLARRLTAELPQGVSDIDEILHALKNTLQYELNVLSEGCIVDFADGRALEVGERVELFIYEFSLKELSLLTQYTLCFKTKNRLSKEQHSLLEILLPYIASAIEEGYLLSNLSDEHQQLQEQRESYKMQLATHKRENVLRRVWMSVVTGMTPYMDRMSHELNKLDKLESETQIKQSLQYITELTEKIDEYNDILTYWIKMRSGELRLHIENFELQGLFDVISKNRQSFAMRDISYEVLPTSAVVKGDKTLTLFMINTISDNALKFTPKGGVVKIFATENEDDVEITIQDSGVGMSDDMINIILCEKVYDLGSIDDKKSITTKKKKDGGFGLLNCKGILDKYRKTDSIFSKSTLEIESKIDLGTKVSFRLPKGIMRRLLVLCVIVLSTSSIVFGKNNAGLNLATSLTDSVYISNLRGDYLKAIEYVDLVLKELNRFYLENSLQKDTLTLRGKGNSPEINWWRDGFGVDSLREEIYYNLLDVRNEASIAFLALKRWDDYRYNNNAYNRLYRVVHEDKGLNDYFLTLQKTANMRRAAVFVFISVLFVLVLVLMIFYFRRVVVERMNLRLVLDINRKLLSATKQIEEAGDTAEKAQIITKTIFKSFNDLIPILELSIAIYDVINKKMQIVSIPETGNNEILKHHLTKVYNTKKEWNDTTGYMNIAPLIVEIGGERPCVGSICYITSKSTTENEKIAIELVVAYIASVAYHSTVRVEGRYRDIEQLTEDMQKVRYEENKLYVQNQVIDNCLSVIKHETIYYPSRIRQLVEQLKNENLNTLQWKERISTMRELMEYYNEIFSILARCATRQLNETGFRREVINVGNLRKEIEIYVLRKQKRFSHKLIVETCCEIDSLCADAELLKYLLESLLDATFGIKKDGRLKLRMYNDDNYLRIELLDYRSLFSQPDIEDLFIPSRRNIPTGVNALSNGVEYLIVKEIVREHEEYVGKRGCRLDAEIREDCSVIICTLPI